VVVLLVWIGAVVVSAVVLSFCAYELAWKSRRLRGDLGKLTALSSELTALQGQLSDAQLRAVEARH
jgi:ABC-type glycerol-3-phosphate transport system permease component